MTAITKAHPGQEVALSTDVTDGDGQSVSFHVTTADGEVITDIPADVVSGVARAVWTVDVGTRPLPVEVRFAARLGAETADSGALTVEASAVLANAGWVRLAAGTGGAGSLAPLDGEDPLSRQPTPFLRYDDLRVGEAVAMRVEVSAGMQPLKGDFAVSFELQKEQTKDQADFVTVGSLVREVSAPSGVEFVAVRWIAGPMDKPAPYRFRFVASWVRRPNESFTPDAERGRIESRAI